MRFGAVDIIYHAQFLISLCLALFVFLLINFFQNNNFSGYPIVLILGSFYACYLLLRHLCRFIIGQLICAHPESCLKPLPSTILETNEILNVIFLSFCLTADF